MAKWWQISCILVRVVEAGVVDEGGVDRVGKLLCKAPWHDWLALAENVYSPPPISFHILTIVMYWR